MTEIEQLEQAIAALEGQRLLLGDAVVDAALAPMRAKLAALQPAATPAAPPVTEQRKVVTVLFADLAGFTAMSEKLDPEDVREILDEYFRHWTGFIEKYGGTVEKFIGDAVMAVFGLPTAREDDAERAVRTALDMRAALEELNAALEPRYGVRLSMRTGIHTGPVVARFGAAGARRDGNTFAVVGDTVNLASRLQSAAPTNGILVSYTTYRLVRGVFDIQALDPLQVKGKQEAVQAYLILRLKPRAFRRPRDVEGIETHMIGRQAELKRLQDALYAAIEDRRRQVFTLTGEAGLGKSRLLAEFDDWLELLPEVIRYFKGRATAAMQHQAYSLIRDLFTFRFEIQDSDPPQEVWEKMLAGAGDPRRARLIGRLLGFDFGALPEQGDARQFRELALAALVDFFKSQTAQRPVVILLEDIHWADDSSLEVIEHLAQAMAGEPLLIVAAARPQLYERRPEWGRDQRDYFRLDLQPLSRRESRQLVLEILQRVDEVPASLCDRVVNSAEGNPFFMEELVKMLMEDGVIVPGDERWSVVPGKLAGVRIPPTLMEVLQARFDSLPVGERALLQRASVVGRIFWDQAVEFLAAQQGPAANSTGHALTDLRTREMIYQREGSAFEDTQEYAFKHSLLRDVTYESMLRRERRFYHAHAARWLEQVIERSHRAEEYAALIADHYDQAGETGPAMDWYQRAGEQAAAKFAHAEALRCFTRALALVSPGELVRRVELLLGAEKVYEIQGQVDLQAKTLEELLALEGALAAVSGPQVGRAAALRAEIVLQQAVYVGMSQSLAEAQQASQRAIELARAAGAVQTEASAYLRLGSFVWRAGQYRQARPPLEQALALARANGLIFIELDALRNLGIVQEAEGDFDAARRSFEQSLERYRELGSRRGEGMSLNSLGIVAHSSGNYLESRRHLEESLRIKREIGDRRGEETTLTNLALSAYALGDHQLSRQYSFQALTLSEQHGDLQGAATSCTNLGSAALYQGDFEAAEEYLRKAERLFGESGDQQGESEAVEAQGELALLRGDLATARRLAEKSMEMMAGLEIDFDLGRGHFYNGNVLAAHGQQEAARQAYTRSLEIHLRLGQPQLAQEPRAGLARLALQAGDLEAARQQVEAVLALCGEFAARQPRPEDVPGEPGLYGTSDPFQVYWVCCQVLRALKDDRYAAVLTAAFELLERQVDILSEAEQRRRFVENFAARQAILAAAQALGEVEEHS